MTMHDKPGVVFSWTYNTAVQNKNKRALRVLERQLLTHVRAKSREDYVSNTLNSRAIY